MGEGFEMGPAGLRGFGIVAGSGSSPYGLSLRARRNPCREGFGWLGWLPSAL